LESQRCRGHEIDVGLEHPELAEPHRHALAVVVVAECGVEDHRIDPGEDDDREHEVHELVEPRRGAEDAVVRASAVDEQREPADRGRGGAQPHGDGHEVVHVVGDPDRRCPRLRRSGSPTTCTTSWPSPWGWAKWYM